MESKVSRLSVDVTVSSAATLFWLQKTWRRCRSSPESAVLYAAVHHSGGFVLLHLIVIIY